LASLVAKELLSVQADPRSPERGQYGFLQDLVRTVAYETLSRRDRRQKHLAAAAYLERSWGAEEEEIVEVVAAHYVDAYQLAPDAPDAPEIGEKARRMLVRAGERAASLAAAAEARAYFQQAAELTNSPLVEAELNERAGQMAFLEGNGELAERALGDAVELFTAAGQPHAAARVEARVAQVEFTSGRLEQAVDRIRHAHEVLAGDEPDPDFAFVTGQLGRFLALIGGHDDEATTALEQALELSEHLQLPDVYSNALSSRGVLLARRARVDEATMLLQRALEVALEHDLTDAAQRAHNNLAWAWEAQDRYDAVAALAEQALALVRRAGDRVGELSWLSGSIASLVFLGRWEDALAIGDELPDPRNAGALSWPLAGGADLALVHVRRGDVGGARKVMDAYASTASPENLEVLTYYEAVRCEVLRAERKHAEAVAIVERLFAEREALGPVVRKRPLVQAIEAALDAGNPDKADEFLDVLRRAKPGEISPFLRAHSARLEARLVLLRREDSPVEHGFAAAAEGFRELQMPFERGVALVEHGEWLCAVGRRDEAEPLLAEAAEIFKGLQARPWLERVTGATRAAVGAETAV